MTCTLTMCSTYTPKNSDYDGKFRQISVKVKRSGVDVQARKGYYAVSARYDTPVMAFEAPALALLSGNKSQPNAFESQDRRLQLSRNQPSRGWYRSWWKSRAAISISSATRIRKHITPTLLSSRWSKMSSDIRYAKSAASTCSLDRSINSTMPNAVPILFYRETDLEPGKYIIDSIVYDATNNHSSVSHGTVDRAGFAIRRNCGSAI